MTEIKTESGDTYIVMGQRVLKNNQRLKYNNCPVVLWVGCSEDSGKKVGLQLGKKLSIRFNCGYYSGGRVVSITNRD